ncbi:MAG: hypothetical protein ACRDQB_18430, partial [Thermocrispum sp.]
GQVAVAEQPAPTGSSWPRRLSRLLGTDRPWQTPVADPGPVAGRYRRMLGRLRGTHGVPLRLLVVVADDDPAGRAVAQRLVAEAADDGHAATNGRAGTGHENGGIATNGSSSADPTLRLVEVVADGPDVPADPAMSGALVVVAAGSRTGWELTGLSEACLDAGHRVVGVVVARPTRPRTEAPAEQPAKVAAEQELAGAS